MQSSDNHKTWNACGYVRLSCEDGDKEESNSVTGQKNLIRDYLSRRPHLIECGMKVDDGFSGSDFERPAFREMMEEVSAGKINCIVVKDLSRFGRNYLDAGEYIERIFPRLGVRFIAINDNYDSENKSGEMDALLIPFKNLINEAYCRDISVKIRSQLAVKRKRGDFVGSFAVYGYRKDSENKNRLAVDAFAAEVVRDIFRQKLAGVSAGDIADGLNEEGVLPPMAYKKSLGLNYATPFRGGGSPSWNASAVLRILKNPVYTGTLVQGKSASPGWRVKGRMEKPRGEWDIAEGAHEAIIDKETFAVVQKVLAGDTRTSPGGRAVEIFSGMVFCGECGGPMVRKTVPAKNRKYVYYVCGNHKNEKTCFSHSISHKRLMEIVQKELQEQIKASRNPQDSATAGDGQDSAPEGGGQACRSCWRDGKQGAGGTPVLFLWQKTVQEEKYLIGKYEERLGRKQEEAEKYRRILDSLCESLAEGVIDRQEYGELEKSYRLKLEQAWREGEEIREKMNRAAEEAAKEKRRWEQIERCGSITEFDRTMAVFLIDRIFIYRDKNVKIIFNDKF